MLSPLFFPHTLCDHVEFCGIVVKVCFVGVSFTCVNWTSYSWFHKSKGCTYVCGNKFYTKPIYLCWCKKSPKNVYLRVLFQKSKGESVNGKHKSIEVDVYYLYIVMNIRVKYQIIFILNKWSLLCLYHKRISSLCCIRSMQSEIEDNLFSQLTSKSWECML